MTAALFGHSHPLITSALINAIQSTGLNLGGTTKLEAQHAALLCERFNLDLIRFTNSGTEANLHAIAAAKRFTGRRKVVVFGGGYHGGCFAFPGEAPAENCVDRGEWIVATYNDLLDTKRKIEENGDEVAAVLVEGMQGAGPCIVGSSAFLKQVEESARKVGAVFILDEVMTSRLSGGGLQEVEGLKPDLTTMGKYLGGGLTFGAFGGRGDVMGVYGEFFLPPFLFFLCVFYVAVEGFPGGAVTDEVCAFQTPAPPPPLPTPAPSTTTPSP